jgi:hypothetical protein
VDSTERFGILLRKLACKIPLANLLNILAVRAE